MAQDPRARRRRPRSSATADSIENDGAAVRDGERRHPQPPELPEDAATPPSVEGTVPAAPPVFAPAPEVTPPVDGFETPPVAVAAEPPFEVPAAPPFDAPPFGVPPFDAPPFGVPPVEASEDEAPASAVQPPLPAASVPASATR